MPFIDTRFIAFVLSSEKKYIPLQQKSLFVKIIVTKDLRL